jgi:hypothetical protein
MKRFSISLALLLSFAGIGQLAASPIAEYTSSDTLVDFSPYTLGYEFITSTNFNIDALGYWDDGLQNDHEVGIWDTSGTLLVSTTVLGTDPLTGHFRYGSIANFLLAPGTYRIGGEFLGNFNPFPSDAVGVTTTSGFTWVADYQLIGAGLNFPTNTFNNYGNNGIFAANFMVSEGAAVPEPGTISLMLLSILVLGRMSRRTAFGNRG